MAREPRGGRSGGYPASEVDPDADAADGVAAFHRRETLGQVREREVGADDGAEGTALEQRAQPRVERLAVVVRREVEAGELLEGHRIVDVRVADPDEGEVPEQKRPGHDPLV